jgi:hypothetical protein
LDSFVDSAIFDIKSPLRNRLVIAGDLRAAAACLAGAFLAAAFLAGALFAGAFLAGAFSAVAFLAVAFFVVAFFAAAFFAVAFLAAAFFAAAILCSLCAVFKTTSKLAMCEMHCRSKCALYSNLRVLSN